MRAKLRPSQLISKAELVKGIRKEVVYVVRIKYKDEILTGKLVVMK